MSTEEYNFSEEEWELLEKLLVYKHALLQKNMIDKFITLIKPGIEIPVLNIGQTTNFYYTYTLTDKGRSIIKRKIFERRNADNK